MQWDVFCKVIDNYGDIGVCWRLAADLAARGEHVRLWVDDASALRWMAPHGHPGVAVHDWAEAARTSAVPGDVVVEAFGCELDPGFVGAMAAAPRAPAWINLEYLTAESFAERAHGLPSPVLAGPGAGLVKRFFYPGFTPRTGGLLREPLLAARQEAFDGRARDAWRARQGLRARPGEKVVSLFCYEPDALGPLLAQWAAGSEVTHLLVTAGRAAAAVRDCLARDPFLQRPGSPLQTAFLPTLTQWDYDHLLWASDLNFVRGEDSLVRALWAGRPFVWHIYPQHDEAHHAKLEAFLQAMALPADVRAFHRYWNGLSGQPAPLPPLAAWGDATANARSVLQTQPDLAQQLLRFVVETG